MSRIRKQKGKGSRKKKQSVSSKKQGAPKDGTSQTKSWAKAEVVQTSLHGSRLLVTGRWDGELPEVMGVKFGRGRPYIPRECRAFRDSIALTIKKAVNKVTDKVPSRLNHVIFDVWTDKERPDLDTAYHQVQDALTKDAFGLDDRYTRMFKAARVPMPAGSGPMWFIDAEYQL